MMIVVRKQVTNLGTALTYGGRTILVTPERLAQAPDHVREAVEFVATSALLTRGEFDRLDEGIRWDRYLADRARRANIAS